jgi:hypothetical protein
LAALPQSEASVHKRGLLTGAVALPEPRRKGEGVAVVTEWETLYRQAVDETDRTKFQESIEVARKAMSKREREISETMARMVQEQMSIREAKHSLQVLAKERLTRDSDVA